MVALNYKLFRGASFKRTRTVSFAGSVNNSILYLIAGESCEGLTSRMTRPNLSDEKADALAKTGPEAALAKGVLVQAKRDLRRFRTAQDRIGREIYVDAYSWIASDDLWWPYSFLNVCEVLGLSPEVLRMQLLTDTRAGWYSHSRRIAQRISTSVRGSLANVFRAHGSVASSRYSNRPALAN